MISTTDYLFSKIAELTDTNFDFVVDVNNGKRKMDTEGNYEYPIRNNPRNTKLTNELINRIISYLKDDILSEREIGDLLNISPFTVGQINRGKSSVCKTLHETYPIRKKPHRNKIIPQILLGKLSSDDVLNVINDLRFSNKPIDEIALEYNVSRVTIQRINTGKTWKNFTTDYDLPLRK